LIEAAENGNLRDDVAPDELASYCLHALAAAGSLPSEAAVRRLVTVTLAGLRPRALGELPEPVRQPPAPVAAGGWTLSVPGVGESQGKSVPPTGAREN
jgi:hypothetical protein